LWSRSEQKLEEQGASNAGFSKEIDHLLTRVIAIEKHLAIDTPRGFIGSQRCDFAETCV
jgi:hypothetical protein